MAGEEDAPDPAESEDGESPAPSPDVGSILAHLYRGEVDRAVNWRTRLDSTTNWAVTIIAGILAYAFAQEDVAHAIILVAMLIGVVFLLIEARRFTRYDIWRSRVRSLQENLFAYALNPSEGVEHRDWRSQLSEDYRNPKARLPLRNALAHRLRRVYLPLLTGLLLIWLFRLQGENEPMVQAATVSAAPGWVVVVAVVAGYVGIVVLTVWPEAAVATETGGSADRGDLRREE